MLLLSIALLALGTFDHSYAQIPSTSVDAIDAFYHASAKQGFRPADHFAVTARCQVVNYTNDGAPVISSLTPNEFGKQVDTLSSLFEIEQQPVVILSRYYGDLATAYLSLFSQLIDKQNGDTLRIRSIQTLQLIKQNEWKIVSLVIQNEVGSFPFSKDMWPDELTKTVKLGLENDSDSLVVSAPDYDPSRLYNVEELDIAPEYPGDPKIYTSLLKTFDVSDKEVENGSPFTVIIEEDGLARLGYVGDLSGAEIERARSFVNSMLIWYPGVIDEASVRTKLVFYLE